MPINNPDNTDPTPRWEASLDGAQALIGPDGECLGTYWPQVPLNHKQWQFSAADMPFSKEEFTSGKAAKSALIEHLIRSGSLREDLKEILTK